jgi:LmbE family N-acetylglucosaminyl deacetylase
VKACFEDFRAAVDPDWVLSHHGADRHQDHALLSQVTWQTFRDHPIWEYEIPKYDGDLGTPNAYVPLPAEVAQQKVKAIMKAFRTQSGKSWFRAENLLAVMRLRGLDAAPATAMPKDSLPKLVFSTAPHPTHGKRQ